MVHVFVAIFIRIHSQGLLGIFAQSGECTTVYHPICDIWWRSRWIAASKCLYDFQETSNPPQPICIVLFENCAHSTGHRKSYSRDWTTNIGTIYFDLKPQNHTRSDIRRPMPN